MEIEAAATMKADDQDSGRGSLNSGSQTVICIFIPKLDVKVTIIIILINLSIAEGPLNSLCQYEILQTTGNVKVPF